MKFTANETGGNFSETAYGSAFFAQYEFNLFYLQRGNKHYELTNHLGNVLTVITDKRLLSCMGDTIQSSSANIVSATDYSPFGAPLAGRTFSAKEYRFGFNSKEKDDETYGEGNAYDFGARIYDARKGRFLSVDPALRDFCWNAPYIFADNSPISTIDFDGKFPLPAVYLLYEGTLVAIEIIGTYAVIQKITEKVPLSVMANRSPDFDWQRSQDRIQKSKYIATQVIFKKMIDEHFNQDPNEFKNPKGRWGGKLGLVVGSLFLLDQVQSELKRMKETTQADYDATNKNILELKSKDKLSTNEQDRLKNLERKSVDLKLNLEGISGAIDETAKQIKKVKVNESKSQNPADATEYVMPNVPR